MCQSSASRCELRARGISGKGDSGAYDCDKNLFSHIDSSFCDRERPVLGVAGRKLVQVAHVVKQKLKLVVFDLMAAFLPGYSFRFCVLK